MFDSIGRTRREVGETQRALITFILHPVRPNIIPGPHLSPTPSSKSSSLPKPFPPHSASRETSGSKCFKQVNAKRASPLPVPSRLRRTAMWCLLTMPLHTVLFIATKPSAIGFLPKNSGEHGSKNKQYKAMLPSSGVIYSLSASMQARELLSSCPIMSLQKRLCKTHALWLGLWTTLHNVLFTIR